jgi:hypothetical protein
MADDAMKEFKKENTKNFDHLFKSYGKAFRPAVKDDLKMFMKSPSGKGRKYFTCKLDKMTAKCDKLAEPTGVGFTMFMSITEGDKLAFFDELQTETGIASSWVKFDKDSEDGYEATPINT